MYDFVVDAELFDVQITLQTPFPGTPLEERLRREDRLLHDGQWQRCTLFDVNYRPAGMSADELRSQLSETFRTALQSGLDQVAAQNFNRKYLRPATHCEEVLE